MEFYTGSSRTSPISAMTSVKMKAITREITMQISNDTRARRLVNILFQTKEKMTPSHIAINDSTNKIMNVRLITTMLHPEKTSA